VVCKIPVPTWKKDCTLEKSFTGLIPPPLSTHPTRHNKAIRPLRRAILRALPQPPLREPLPNLARILPAGKRRIRIEDRIPRRHKVGITRLEREAIQHELHGEVLSICGDAL